LILRSLKYGKYPGDLANNIYDHAKISERGIVRTRFPNAKIGHLNSVKYCRRLRAEGPERHRLFFIRHVDRYSNWKRNVIWLWTGTLSANLNYVVHESVQGSKRLIKASSIIIQQAALPEIDRPKNPTLNTKN
jgi:hypothetical protein